MAGFADLPVGDSTVFGGTATAAPAAVAAPAQSGGGGIGGFIYNHLIKPTVSTVAGGISDIPKIGEATYDLGRTAAAGITQNKAALTNALNAQKNVVQSSSFNKNYLAPSAAAYKSGDYVKGVEQGLGAAGSNISNVLAPVAGGGAAGDGIMALAKTGAKVGAVQGASSAAAQGASGGNVINSALEGGALGGVTGAGAGVAGKAIGAVANRLASKADVSAGDAGTSSVNPFAKIANKSATNKAQNAYADLVQNEFGLGGKTVSDNGTPINNILSQMQSHRIEPTATNMAKYGNAGFGYNDFLENSVLPNSSTKMVPLDLGAVLKNAVQDQPGLRASTPKITSELRNTISNSLAPDGNISGLYHPGGLLKAATDLYNAKPANAAEAAVYNKARQGLIDAAGKEGGLNDIIKGTQLPSVKDAMTTGAESTPENSAVQHLVDAASGNPTLAQELVDNINKASTVQDIQKAEIPHIAANDIATSNAKAIGKTLPVPEKSSSGAFSSVGSPSGAYYATRELTGAFSHPLEALPLVARAGHNAITDQLAKLGTPDLEQVGARVAPDVSGNAPSDTFGSPQAPSIAPATAPTPTVQGVNLPQTLAGLAGNGAGQPSTASSQVPGGLDVSGITNQISQAQSLENPQPTESADSIPGGSLTDLQAEIQADPKNATVYEAIYDDAQKEIAASAPTKLNTTEAKNLANIQNATDTLNTYVQGLNSLSSNTRGAGIGTLTALLGKVGLGGADATTAARLESSKEELAIQLAQAMNNGTKPAATQVAQIKAMLPGVGDPKALATQKIQTLSENLSNYLENAVGASPTNRSSGNTSSILAGLSGTQ